MVFKDPSYKVKNTFVEMPAPPEPEADEMGRTRRARSEHLEGVRHSPLVVAAKSPTCSPQLQPVDEMMQAVPIDECDFELLEEAALLGGTVDPSQDRARNRSRGDSLQGETPVAQSTPGLGRDEPAYVVPTTPSPFLHSAFAPSAVPPFGAYGYGMPDMGLPPAFGGDGADPSQDPEQFMQGLGYLPPEMYDPNFAYNFGFGWGGMPMDDASGGLGFGGEMAVCPDGLAGEDLQQVAGQDGAWEDQATLDQVATADGGPGGPVAEQGKKEDGSRRGKKKNAAANAVGVAGGSGGGDKKAGSGAGGSAAKEAQPATKKTVEAQIDDGKQATGKEDPEANYTTVMLRNIPNKYTREMLVDQLKQGFDGQFDFMYLPIDFKNKCNVGYGFINFRTPEFCAGFVSQFNGVDVRKCLPGLNSKKIVEVTPARVQGLMENVRRLRNSPVMNQLQDHPEWMPLLFNEHGFEEPFPSPDQLLPPVKPRGRNREAKLAAAAAANDW